MPSEKPQWNQRHAGFMKLSVVRTRLSARQGEALAGR